MIKVYKFICFIFFMQLVATSYANELINSKIFGLANHPDAQMCEVKKIYPFPLKLSKTFPSSKAGQHGLGRISAETKAIHKHFFSLAIMFLACFLKTLIPFQILRLIVYLHKKTFCKLYIIFQEL